MRVLLIAPYPPQRDGIGVYAKAHAESLGAEGHVVSVLSPPEGGGDHRVRFLDGRPFVRAARMARRFDRIVVHYQPALYFRPRRPVAKVLTSLGLLWLAVRAGRRLEVLVHEADSLPGWRPDRWLLGLALRLAGRVSFHTRAEWDGLQANYGVRVRGRLVPHLASPRPVPSRDEARRRLGLPPEGPVFVCPGFLQPSKGFDRALQAFGPVDGAARLFIVGSVRVRTPENVAYAKELADACRRIAGAELVEGFAAEDDFDLWLAAADWVVLPYRRSWSSGVLARAQALGTPAIVADVGGLAEQASEQDVVVKDDRELSAALRSAASGPGAARPPGRTVPVAAGPTHRHGGPIDTDWDPELRTIERTRRGRRVLIALIIISVALAALAQLTLKHGMNQVTGHGETPLSLSQPAETIRRVVLNPSVWGGLLIFVASASVWLIVLSRTSLSFAYPFASLTYVLILLFDRFVLREPISALRYGGVALIIAGLVLISRTSQQPT